MTTAVNIAAHCAETVQVVFHVPGKEPVVLQNGETATVYVYDDNQVTVREERKDAVKPVIELHPGFKFDLGQPVTITISGETGQIDGRAEYQNIAAPMYRLKYRNAMGVASEGWFEEPDLSATV